MQVERFQYDNRIVRNFALATIVWGVAVPYTHLTLPTIYSV